MIYLFAFGFFRQTAAFLLAFIFLMLLYRLIVDIAATMGLLKIVSSIIMQKAISKSLIFFPKKGCNAT